jgi:hypothetical protein
MKRGKFLKSTGHITAAGFITPWYPLIAKPFSNDDFLHSHFPVKKSQKATVYASGSLVKIELPVTSSKRQRNNTGLFCGFAKLTKHIRQS